VIELGTGPCQTSIAPDLTSNGVIVLRDLKVSVSQALPRGGLQVTQAVSFRSDQFTVDMELPLCVRERRGEPATLQLLRDSEPLPSQISLSAGEVLSGLTFVLLDDTGSPVESDESLFKIKNGGVACSWGTRRRVQDTCGVLPDYTAPMDGSSSEDIDLEVTCNIAKLGTLVHSFTVTLVAGKATKWWCVGAASGIEALCGEPGDLLCKLGQCR
jgi:hypothetical protein